MDDVHRDLAILDTSGEICDELMVNICIVWLCQNVLLRLGGNQLEAIWGKAESESESDLYEGLVA